MYGLCNIPCIISIVAIMRRHYNLENGLRTDFEGWTLTDSRQFIGISISRGKKFDSPMSSNCIKKTRIYLSCFVRHERLQLAPILIFLREYQCLIPTEFKWNSMKPIFKVCGISQQYNTDSWKVSRLTKNVKRKNKLHVGSKTETLFSRW